MAFFRQTTFAILVFIEILHVFFSQARYTEFVYGPREHMDSGQVPAGEPILPWTRKSFERDRQVSNYDSSEEDKNVNDYDQLLFQDAELLQKENSNDNNVGSFWFNEGAINMNRDNLYSSESSEEEYFEAPIKRVKRRIIPIGGGGAAKARGDRKRGRTGPFARSRSPWAEPPHHMQGGSIGRKQGPTGSAALFSLYPELAPADWRARRGLEKIKRKKKKNKETVTTDNPKEIQSQSDEIARIPEIKSEVVKVPPQKRHKFVPARKRKAKLSKQLKEEIAVFAEDHGIDKAVSHFSSKLNLPVKPEMVEKFLLRYQSRIQRRASRS